MKSCRPKKQTLRILSKQAMVWESDQRSDTVACATWSAEFVYACGFDFVLSEDSEPVAAGAPLPSESGAGSLCPAYILTTCPDLRSACPEIRSHVTRDCFSPRSAHISADSLGESSRQS